VPSLRLFIALETPPAVADSLHQVVQTLRSAATGVRWEPKEKLHTTIRFLGKTSEAAVPGLGTMLSSVARGRPPAHFRFDGIGFFPDRHRPRVIWVGIDDPSRALSSLRRELDDELEKLGIEPERSDFHPHLTLGRIKDPRGVERLLAKTETVTFQSDPVLIREVVLFRSQLTREGAAYSVTARFPFGGEAPVT